MSRERGFSFIELMMTLAIMGTLVLVCVPMAELAVQRNRERELRVALVQIREALDAYKRAADEGRIELRPGDSGYPPSLAALVSGVPDQRSPTRRLMYFLRALPGDPLAQPESGGNADWGLRSHDSPADDPQSGIDVFDVYSRSDKTGLNGVPYRQW